MWVAVLACQLTSYLAPEFEQVYAVDFSKTMLATARQRIESRGVTNVRLLSGTAQEFPEVISSANVIQSYQLLQYLTLADFSQHLHECRRVLNKGGMVCAAMIPNSAMKDLYYHGKLIANEVQLVGGMLRWIRLTRRRVIAHFQRDLLWDGIGNWFSQADIERAAYEAGFDVEFRNSWLSILFAPSNANPVEARSKNQERARQLMALAGCQNAVDGYFAESGRFPCRIDAAGWMGIKA